jgi:hypothetical protein
MSDYHYLPLRAALRLNVRRWKRSGKLSHDEAAAALAALAEADRSCVMCRAVEEHVARQAGDVVDEILKLFEWLLDHADEIIALILKLLPLFTDL